MQDRHVGAARRSDSTVGGSGIWSRARVGLAVLALTILVGLGHPGAIPSSYAQSSPIPFDLIGDQAAVSLAGELPAHDPTVGRLAGSAGVSGGSASYEIPIAIPPGRRGMQPSVSLNYSSRAGNGIAGMGWSLSGLSSLHRCPQTLEQDGQIRAVQLDANDRLCLDGQRLVATSGAYGASGATYGTEMESFTRITQLGGDLTSVATYFKVERKSGEIAYYGNTGTGASTARVVPGGVSVPLTWMVARTEDRVGNAMHYAYTSYGDGETLVNAIRYTGTPSAVGNRLVSFNYEDRPVGAGTNDRSSSYLAGGLTRQTKRLTSIVTFVDSTPVRSYVLSYGSSVSTTTGRSLLQAVADCAYDGANWVCKPPTTFAWQQGAIAHQMKIPSIPLGTGADVVGLQTIGDMDGDGATEVVAASRTGSTYGNHLVSLTPERTVRWAMAIPSNYAVFALGKGADFNQDGRVDFVARDSGSGTIVIRAWSGSPTDTDFTTALGTILNTGIAASGTGSVAEGVEHVGDMDGDGRADIVIVRRINSGAGSCSVKIFIYRNTPNGSAPPTFPEMATHCLNVPHVGDVMYEGEKLQGVSDFDGDGLPDLMIGSNLAFWNGAEKGRRLERIVFGTRTGSGYSLTSKSFSTLFQTGHARTSQEGETGLFTMWSDVNGDGLRGCLKSLGNLQSFADATPPLSQRHHSRTI